MSVTLETEKAAQVATPLGDSMARREGFEPPTLMSCYQAFQEGVVCSDFRGRDSTRSVALYSEGGLPNRIR